PTGPCPSPDRAPTRHGRAENGRTGEIMPQSSARVEPITAAVPGRVTGALRTVEAVLLRGGGQRTARRNAWAAVCEDRRRAGDRREAQSVLDLDGPGRSTAR